MRRQIRVAAADTVTLQLFLRLWTDMYSEVFSRRLILPSTSQDHDLFYSTKLLQLSDYKAPTCPDTALASPSSQVHSSLLIHSHLSDSDFSPVSFSKSQISGWLPLQTFWRFMSAWPGDLKRPIMWAGVQIPIHSSLQSFNHHLQSPYDVRCA